MAKSEQNRVVAWRLRIIREARELPRAWLRPAGNSASLAKLSTNGGPGTKALVTPAFAMGLERLFCLRVL